MARALAVCFASAFMLAHLARRQRNAAMRNLCAALPKAELHAHLHGCARPATVVELAPADVAASSATVQLLERGGRSLSECFAIFDVLHRTVTSRAAVSRIAAEALQDFAADGVRPEHTTRAFTPAHSTRYSPRMRTRAVTPHSHPIQTPCTPPGALPRAADDAARPGRRRR